MLKRFFGLVILLIGFVACAPATTFPQTAAGRFGEKNMKIGSVWLLHAEYPENAKPPEDFRLTITSAPVLTSHNNLYFQASSNNLKASVFLVDDIFYVVVFRNPSIIPDGHTDEGPEDSVRCLSKFEGSLNIGDGYLGASFFGNGMQFSSALSSQDTKQFGRCLLTLRISK